MKKEIAFFIFYNIKNNAADTTSIAGDNISNIKDFPGGKLWVQTSGGTNIYDPANEKFDRNMVAHLQKIGIPSNNVFNIIKDKEGNFLFHNSSRGDLSL